MTKPSTFRTDEVIADRFRVVRLIDHGGMAEVYEAADLELDENIALKVVRIDRTRTSESASENLKREVQLARKVTHPNVCRVFDVFRHRDGDSDLLVVTMELLRGKSLDQRLREHGRMALEEAFPLIAQMARALQAAHAAGIVHRDFKTRNVMLVPDAAAQSGVRAVVTDFGIALPVGDDSLDGDRPAIAGTPSVMSPEQLQGLALNHATDIYSLGLVMYEMLTGEKPHTADSPMKIMTRRLSTPPPSPHDLVPDLDPRWERAIVRCLQHEPADRFPSVGALLAELFKTETGPAQRLETSAPNRARPNRLFALAAAAIIVVGLQLYLYAPNRDRAPLPPPSPVQVTTSAGLEVDPAFSPDGTTIAFSANTSGAFEIHLRELASGRETQLTEDGGQNFQPDWSPDGSTILYHSRGSGGIWSVPVAGGEPSQVVDFGSHPRWSPDGGAFVFQSDSKVQVAANSTDAQPPSTLWVKPNDGPAAQLTVQGQPDGGHGAPAWSPDGKRIVFSNSSRRTSEIWSISIDGGDLLRLIAAPSVSYKPHISPDRRHLYFAAVTDDERYGVWRAPLSRSTGRPTGDPENILNLGLMNVRHFAISPDGGRMVFSGLATRSNLVTLPLDPATSEPSGPPEPLTSGSGRNNRPVFSPDGSTIAFDRWHIGVNQNIWTIGADGSGLHQVTRGTAPCTQASFFPEGDRIAYLSNLEGEWALFGIAIDGTGAERLVDLGAGAGWARLSPDARSVAFHSSAGGSTLNLWTTSLDGDRLTQLTFDDELMAFPTWAPDGRTIVFEAKFGDNMQMAIIAADGGPVEVLTDFPGNSWPYSFSPDGDKIAFAGFRDDSWDLWWLSLSGRRLRRLTDNTALNAYVRYPAWSPSGDRIVYELAESTGDLWMVENLR